MQLWGKSLLEESSPYYDRYELVGKGTITIAIVGVDSRLGVQQARADANHVLRISLDRGTIKILSVPRGTYADAGFSSKALNILANYRARKGRSAYLAKLAEITGVGKIDYYVEVGFAQAIGIFELLGFKGSAVTTLHLLRTRKAFGTGDHQRCYNQAQFIRQMLLKHFPRREGMLDALSLRAALAIAETNLRYDVVQMIIAALRAKGFPRGPQDVTVELCPRRVRVQEFDLSSPEKVTALAKVLDRRMQKAKVMPSVPTFRPHRYQQRLHRMLITAAHALDRGNARYAIAVLERPYAQRAWLQLPDEYMREQYMKLMCSTLIEAYQATGNILKAEDVRYFLVQLGVQSDVVEGTTGSGHHERLQH
ncbi:MAG: hypothetical protein RML15_03645 [Bacteroidota bacterium]|nr:hypothetical protein [Candidatus Kapabacteria bacterium]MDW8074851.1 hypothetical protein [Bacteroidota bacterium]MDW8271490.1 hypothetical protein [Bacteroidota bacterium]